MHHASITVAPDRSAQVTIAGQSTGHPDLGSAMTQLTLWARETPEDVAVALSDDTSLRSLTIAAKRPGQSGSPGAPGPSPAATTAPPPAPPQSHAHILPETEADVPTQPLAAPGAQQSASPTPADPSPAAAPPAAAPSEAGASTDTQGPAYPIGTPFSGPAAPPPPSSSRRIDRVPAGTSARSSPDTDRTGAHDKIGRASCRNEGRARWT